jgi:hypothetical protein
VLSAGPMRQVHPGWNVVVPRCVGAQVSNAPDSHDGRYTKKAVVLSINQYAATVPMP